MKYTLPFFVAFATTSCVDAFHTRPTLVPRTSVTKLKLSTSDTKTGMVTKDDLLGAREAIDHLLRKEACGPFMVRLAWHDSASYDKNIDAGWPKHGGANGSIRFKPEITHGANTGLNKAFDLLVPIHNQFPTVSYADLFQMASARAIETAGGPRIGVRYGRIDVASSNDCMIEGNLPHAEPNKDNTFGSTGGTTPVLASDAQGHLRKVFYRMGFDDEGIVALSGAHTLGRAHKDRSKLGANFTKFTDGTVEQKFADGTTAPFKHGGSSWTSQFFVFDNSYFTTLFDDNADKELLKLTSDKSLIADAKFREYADKFRISQEEFFRSYAKAHLQLSEQGSKFEGEPIELD